MLLRQGLGHEAVTTAQEVVRLTPNDPVAQVRLAQLLEQLNRLDESLIHYRRALALDSESPATMSWIAFILATHPDLQKRDEEEAIRLAERACQLSERRGIAELNSLSIAYASGGRLESAIEAAKEASSLVRKRGDFASSNEFQQRIQAFEAERKRRTAGANADGRSLQR